MSMTASQIYAKIDRSCNTDATSYPLTEKAVDVNLALDDVMSIALQSLGWNTDDFNHAKDPFITANIVSGQRNYYFIRDEQSNLILGINRVMAKDANGIFHTLTPANQQIGGDVESFIDGQNAPGCPTRYDKTGNGIFLDPVPNYAATGGLKLFIDREPSYLLSSDTTKVPGIDGLCHDYLYLKPAYEFARDKGLENTNLLFRDLQVAIVKIKERYATKIKDTPRRLIANTGSCR